MGTSIYRFFGLSDNRMKKISSVQTMKNLEYWEQNAAYCNIVLKKIEPRSYCAEENWEQNAAYCNTLTEKLEALLRL